MAEVVERRSGVRSDALSTSEREPSRQAFRILHVAYVIAPTIAGLDKFFEMLGDWTRYLAPVFPRLLGVPAQTFMLGVGVVEVLAGLLVAVKPRIGAYVVAAWLGGIILNLALLGQYWDIALRDLGLLLGALALGRLASGERRVIRTTVAP